jgi:diacylglycerol kinase family enzyme
VDLVVIYNAQAGDSAWPASRVSRVLREAGHRARIVDREEDWPAALASEPEAFVAAGGDGTVHEVIRTVAKRGSGVPVAILPIGTANNVAHSLGYGVDDDLVARAACWHESQRSLRVGLVAYADEEQLLVEACGIGAFAQQLGREDTNIVKPASPLSLLAMREGLVRRLLEEPPIRVAVEIEDQRIEEEMLLVECVNLGYLGPRLCLAPDQSPDDGSITVCGIAPEDRDVAAHWVSTGEGDVTRFRLGRGRRITITADACGHLDGRRWPTGRLAGTLRIQAGACSVHVTV